MGFFKKLIDKLGAGGAAEYLSGPRRTHRGKSSPIAIVPEFISTPELDRALSDLVGMSGGRRWGVINEMRAALKYLRTQHAARFRKHISPDGQPWQKAVYKFKSDKFPDAVMGRASPIAGNAYYNLRWAKLKSIEQVVRSQDIIDKINNSKGFKANEYKIPALYRPRSYGNLSTAREGGLIKYGGRKGQQTEKKIDVAGVLFGMMTKDKVNGSATKILAKGGAYELQYGLNNTAAQWARKHQTGAGTFMGKPVPRRTFLGMNSADVRYILAIFQNKMQLIAAGKSSAGDKAIA